MRLLSKGRLCIFLYKALRTGSLQRYLHSSRNILQLKERELWNDRFPAISHEFEQSVLLGPQTVYSGFDPTADSLHIGNLLVLIALLHCQRAGHRVLALVGGATGLVGDPSGKNSERPLLEKGVLDANIKGITDNIQRIFNNHKKYFVPPEKQETLQPLQVVNNYDWYKELNVISFLRDIGRHLRMGDMLGRTAVQSRLQANEPLSYSEFSYQVLQAYDWLHLYKKYGCTIQVGGSDQMGNIVAGYSLISRTEDKPVTGLTVPLVTSISGDKLGKTGGNAVWLDPKKTSPFELYQFFVRRPDSEVEKLLKWFTFYPLQDIKNIMKKHWENPESCHAQKKLAKSVVLLVHTEDALMKALQVTEFLYGGKVELLANFSQDDLLSAFEGATVVSLLLEPGISIMNMGMKAGCFATERDADRIIRAGGFYINQARITDPHLVLIPGAHILPNKMTLLRVGKRNYYVVKWHL